MSTAEERRNRLGDAAVQAARQSARDARPPGRTLWDSITVLLTGRPLRRETSADEPVGDPPRDVA